MVNLLLSILAGALVFAAFEPINIWWLAPVGLAMHMYIMNRTTNKYRSAFCFGLTLNLLLLHWTSTYVGALPWLILCFGLAAFYLPLALVKRWGIVAYPLIFLILEEVRNRFPFGGFGWARIAYSQADAPYAMLARFGGASGLSALTISLGLFIYLLATKRFQPILLLPLILIFIPFSITEIGQTKVLLVQGNVPNYGLDFNSRAEQVFKNHMEETRRALAQNPKIDFILWPENAVDVDPFTNSEVFTQLSSFQTPLIVGAIVEKNNQLLNTSILWTKDAQNVYAKQHLTPFGEYIPLRALADKISPFVKKVRDFSPGSKNVTFTVGNAKIGPVICYELLDDGLMTIAANNSNLLAVQTNNATFGRSAQSAQQMSITRIRAIEHSRNVVSVSTTGYSAIIDAKGEITNRTAMGTAEHVIAQVGLIAVQSPRDRLGDWALVISLAWLAAVARLRRIQRR